MFFKKNSSAEAVIVGLGNPGEKYDMTRHNVGFMTVDLLAELYNVKLTKLKFKSLYGTAEIGGKRVLLVKPQTYMNNSGEAVKQILDFYKITADKLVVICDDISLDVGRIRTRKKGSHGGHNGLKSIISLIGTDGFTRVKIGVGAKPHPDYDLADWVLSRFKKDEIAPLEQAVKNAADSCKYIVAGETDKAMNMYNS